MASSDSEAWPGTEERVEKANRATLCDRRTERTAHRVGGRSGKIGQKMREGGSVGAGERRGGIEHWRQEDASHEDDRDNRSAAVSREDAIDSKKLRWAPSVPTSMGQTHATDPRHPVPAFLPLWATMLASLIVPTLAA